MRLHRLPLEVMHLNIKYEPPTLINSHKQEQEGEIVHAGTKCRMVNYMFDSLKKKLKEGVARLSRKAREPEKPKEERPMEKPPEVKPKVMPPKRERPKPEKPRPAAVVKEKPEPVEEIRPEPIVEEPPKEEPVVKELPKEEPVKVEPVIEEPTKEEPVTERPLEKEPEVEDIPEKRGRFARLRGIRERVSTREISEEDIDDFFKDSEFELLQSDVALEVADSLKEKLKEKLVKSKVKRRKTSDFVSDAFEESLIEIVDQGRVNLEKHIKESGKSGRPFLMVFLGFNGSGKTTTIAKIASYLKARGFKPVLAAGDTFRAASIEQLEVHGQRTGVKVIKHQYGSDSAAVIFDAVKYAEKNKFDVVLADTAGRAHTDKNLMDELRKVVRVNNPDLKVLVVDSLTGNDAVEQARQFHEAVGVDCVVMTKTDVNPRGGSILSVVHTIRKPILFLGTGQDYSNLEMFEPKRFVKQLME
jgi:fused signal recognition particle receptor